MGINDSQFMNDEEKEYHYFSQSHIDKEWLKVTTDLKVYEGADFLLYHWTEDGEVQILTSYMITDTTLNMGRVWVTLMDKQTYRLFKVGNIPVKVGGYDVAIAVPTRVTIEKTLKRTRQKGYLVEGITAGMKCYSRSDPSDEVPKHCYLIPHNQMYSIIPRKQLQDALEEVSDGR